MSVTLWLGDQRPSVLCWAALCSAKSVLRGRRAEGLGGRLSTIGEASGVWKCSAGKGDVEASPWQGFTGFTVKDRSIAGCNGACCIITALEQEGSMNFEANMDYIVKPVLEKERRLGRRPLSSCDISTRSPTSDLADRLTRGELLAVHRAAVSVVLTQGMSFMSLRESARQA